MNDVYGIMSVLITKKVVRKLSYVRSVVFMKYLRGWCELVTDNDSVNTHCHYCWHSTLPVSIVILEKHQFQILAMPFSPTNVSITVWRFLPSARKCAPRSQRAFLIVTMNTPRVKIRAHVLTTAQMDATGVITHFVSVSIWRQILT